MKKLVKLNCPNCGGGVNNLPDGKYECKFCHSIFDALEGRDEESEQLATLLVNAVTDMQLGKFDEAADEYRIIIKNFPDEVRAYWGAFLAEYGVEYVVENGRRRPICHRINRLSALDSVDLREVYARSSAVERESYIAQAEEIEHVRSQSYEISRTQERYEIFICHGKAASEADKAEVLYKDFVSSGRKVFMPSKCIPYGERNAEVYVYPAIESAKYMLVIAESIDSLTETENTWRRFIADKSKKIQVLHNGLNEQNFPADIRRTVQRLQPISLNDMQWRKAAVEFATESGKASAPAAAVGAVDKAYVDELVSRLEHAGGMYDRGRVDNLTEAFVTVLSCVASGNTYEGERALNEQLARFRPTGEVRNVAELCLELAKLTKASEAERRNCMSNIANITGSIKSTFPMLTVTERGLYSEVGNAKLLVYLAKCFGAIKDYSRQCFVLDMIDYKSLYDTRMINELIGMLFKNGRYEDVKNVLRAVPQIDGDYVLVSVLKNYNGPQKQMILLDVADKMRCTDAVESELNYWLATCDDTDTALTVVGIMSKNNIALSAMALNGALSRVRDPLGLRTVLNNIGSRTLMGAEVDKIIEIAAYGGEASVNEALGYLRNVARITDIGVHNMSLLLDRCNLSKIKMRLFEFNIDKKLAERLLSETLRGSSPDRLSNVNVLVDYVPSVDISAYERLLLGNDPGKMQLLELLVPRTGKFASYNPTIEKYLASSVDDEIDKRAVFALFGDFPFSDRARELYLNIIPDEYDGAYTAQLTAFLENNPAKARELFVKHYEALRPGYDKILTLILDYMRHMPEDGVVRFVCDFRGEQPVKDKLFVRLLEFLDKPKAIEVTLRDVTCNLAQAYLLTMNGPTNATADIIASLRKKGVKDDDKVVSYGKKLKFKDYLNSCELSSQVVNDIFRLIK